MWPGARIAGETNRSAIDLATATHARGGPRIVLASVAYSGRTISEDFFTSLVLL